ncbi:MAG: TraR/DksA C4-type zinc finger protein [Acidimicrobiia bacterium]|nr:TraR/DksA C4-type zinc finger protein [Acidimicrobiia bacterium]
MAALGAERRRLLTQIDALARTHGDIIQASELVATDDEHDPEGATIAFEREQIHALLREARAVLAEVEDAFARLSAGTYGSCSTCGRAIDAHRLEARPATPWCLDCAR